MRRNKVSMPDEADDLESDDDLLVRIDPRLRVPDSSAYHVRAAAEGLFDRVTVFLTSSYDMPLAAEIVDERVRIRAATGDEVAEFMDDGPAEDEADRDGKDESDAQSAAPLDPRQAITWREAAGDDDVTEKFIQLWSGEVLLNNGRGVSGPFYREEMAARAWAFSTALSMPEAEICAAQAVGYRCAESKASSLLLADGDAEYRRLLRFAVSPVRSGGVVPVPLPTGAAEQQS